ncbi:MAG: YabP/YqfC family sporulation protein [Acutalibacteraceae bacterium]|nr:YabP/YqfC family sporulation protein [Acutalibacteraceae bacterium]
MGSQEEKGLKKLPIFCKEILGSAPYLQFNSNREVTLDGCKGILEYQNETIRISTGKMVIAFKGRGLNIKCLTATSVVIKGYITTVEFIR